jgi:hypothetical protein
MNTAESSDRVVSMPRPWWSAINGRWLKVPRLLRFILVVGTTIGLICAGGYMFASHSKAANAGYLFSRISGTRGLLDQQGRPQWSADIPFLSTALRVAIVNDRWVILGSFLVLITCAVVFGALASYSPACTTVSRFILAAVFVTTAAHLLENTLILWGLDRPRNGLLGQLPDAFWNESPAAMGAVKWSALVVALAAIPAAFLSVIGRAGSCLRTRRYRRHHDGRNWWDAALCSPAPDPDEGDPEAAWRQAYFVPDDAAEPLAKRGHLGPTALCLSGGGIRSACVSMGAMQTLAGPRPGHDSTRHRNGDPEARAPVLDGFDWVISVSGGGFSAGALLLGVQCEATDGSGAIAPLCERYSPGSVEFDFLRRRSSYIAGSPFALLRALAEVLKNLLASLVIVSLSAIIAGWLLGMFVAKVPLAAVVPRKPGIPSDWPHAHPVASLAAIAIPVVGTVICIASSLFCEWKSTSPQSAKWQARFTWLGEGATLLALLVFALTVAGPGLMWLCLQRPDKGPAGAIGGIAAVVVLQYGATLSTISKKDSFLNPARWLKFVPSGAVRIALVLLTLGVLLVGWLLVLGIVAAHVFDVEIEDHLANLALTSDPMTGWLALIALLALLLSFFDVTSLSLHPFYRKRLASTFAVRRLGKEAVEYDPREATWLDVYGKAQAGGPKFVFAAAAAISDGPIRPPPGLNAVSFVMTADYVGGPALGWLKTAALREAAPARIERDLTVQAAMAVSAAAFASAMGRHSKGMQTLLALSGARLGTWLPNPTFVRNAQHKADDPSFPKALPSVRGAGYFYRELLGINKFDARLIQVTDGGHYENLGLVEALRRRCRLIYCIDGGGDAPPLLSGLADAIRLARFELGVEITMENGDPFGVENLAPGSGDQFSASNALYSLNARITKGAVVRGVIKYPRAAGLEDEASRGWLIVAKAVLWRELPDWVLTYAAEKGGAEFPHDNTSDQWFTEAQFAAYTELGRRIASSAIDAGEGSPPRMSPLEAATNGEAACGGAHNAPHMPETVMPAPAPVLRGAPGASKWLFAFLAQRHRRYRNESAPHAMEM